MDSEDSGTTSLPPPQPEGPPIHQCKKDKDWWDNIKPYAELLGLVALIIYTGYTIKMYRANKRAADAATSAASTAAQAYQDSKTSFQQTLGEMRDQTSAQQRAADTAASVSGTTREALTSVQRAFIAFSGNSTLTKIIVDNKITQLRLHLPWVNEGTTPTRRAVGRVNWQAIPSSPWCNPALLRGGVYIRDSDDCEAV